MNTDDTTGAAEVEATGADHRALDPSEGRLPNVSVSDRHRRVQAAAFMSLFDDGTPVTPERIAARAGLSRGAAARLLADFAAAGRVRFDDAGCVVGIAGLSIEPTRHRLDVSGRTRWTWCALDAVGILGALRRDARLTTRTPDSDRELTLAFTADGPHPTDAVIFITDGYGNDSVVDTWCPTVNMFDDATSAAVWARSHGVTGRPVPVAELAPDATAMWAPLVAE